MAVYAALFGVGFVVYGQLAMALLVLGLAAAAGVAVVRLLPRVGV